MTKLRLDFDELQKAAEDTDREAFDYFLDRATGEMVILSAEIIERMENILSASYDDDIADFDDVEQEEIPEIPDWMEDEMELAMEVFMFEQDRYERIPERSPADTYAAMKRFAETLDNRQVGEILLQALSGQGCFRKFKNALTPFPKERKLWHGYNAKAAKKEIEKWLASTGIFADAD
jgi:hypothetical protein